MWRTCLQVVLVLTCVGVGGAEHLQDVPENLQERLDALEDLVASQTQTQRILQDSLKKETSRRLALETLLLGTLEEEKVKVERLESNFKLDHERLLALEATFDLQGSTELPHNVIFLELLKRVRAVEGDLDVITLLDSRMRSLEEQVKTQSEDTALLQDLHHQIRRGVENLKREVRRQRDTVRNLAATHTHMTQTTIGLEAHLDNLTSWCLALNESAFEGNAQLLEMKKNSEKLNWSLSDVQVILKNLTEAIVTLQHHKEDAPLMLCPLPYRKVGRDCFYLLEERMSWQMAREACKDHGAAVGGLGDLAEPSEMSAFRSYVYDLQTDSEYLWVGAMREIDDGWKWVSGRNMEVMSVPWDLSEPDNTSDQHHLCVYSLGSIKFHDCTHKAMLSAICQVS
nr:uncharacterized protein LOC123746023 isoform X1 [Procambarus clarkii]